MPRTNLLINSFNTGEVSPLIESRSDLSKYGSACKTLENALPLVEGGAKKMPGTYYAGATKSNAKSRLVPFQFSTAQGAILEFSQGIIRVWEAATEGSWSLGLVQQVPTPNNYNPATAYVANDVVLVGPTCVLLKIGYPPTLAPGVLYITAPYGTTNANSVAIAAISNTSDSLSVTVSNSSPNQGIVIKLANTTASNNAANLIQAAIRALGSLNVGTSNFIDLTQWTVTPDPVYFSNPWVTTFTSGFESNNWITQNTVVQCVLANQNDHFPYVAALSGIAVSLSLNSTYWKVFDQSTEPPLELTTPYTEADLFELDCSTQSADVLWVFHPNYPPAVVERQAANQWAYSVALPGQQVGEPAYRGTLDVVKTGYSGLGQSITGITAANPCVVTVAGTGSPFQINDRVYLNLIGGMVELNQGEYQVDSPVVNGDGTFSFSLTDPDTGVPVDSSGFLAYVSGGFAVKVVPMFAATGDYPACGTLYQERLFAGGSDNNPTQLNGSVQDDYPDFICDPNADDYAVQFTLVSNQVNQLLNMIGTPNGLAIGTSGGVWIVTSSAGSSISQTNVNASVQNTQGVSPLQPQVVNGSAVFVSRSARIVTFITYNFVTNQWESTDLTRLNRNITIGTSAATSGLVQTSFQTEPYPIYWGARSDGQLIGLVFNTQDQVYAWFRVNMLPEGGFIESVASISGQNQEDQMVIVVNRTINGSTVRYVEYFMPQEIFHQLSNAFFVHCGQQFQGVGPFAITEITQANPAVVTAPGHTLTDGMSVGIAEVLGMTQANTNPLIAWTVAGVSGDTFELQGIDSTGWGAYTSGGSVEQVTNQVTGMSYLLGQNIVAVGDGQEIFQGPVTEDAVDFGSYANLVTIGLPFRSIVEPLNPIIGNQQATSKSKRQKFTRANVSFYESVGGMFGTDWKHLHAINYGKSSQGKPAAMFTGNVLFDLDSDWEDEGTVLFVHDDPYPFTLRSITPRLSVAEEG